MADEGDPADPSWWVYVLRSHNRRRTYVGIALDPERRLEQHNAERPGGARSTRAGRPWKIGRVYGPFRNRSRASKIEVVVKRLRGSKRLQWTGYDEEE